jgi:hypothetical protein
MSNKEVRRKKESRENSGLPDATVHARVFRHSSFDVLQFARRCGGYSVMMSSTV